VNPQVSVVIVTYNSRDCVGDLLGSMHSHTRGIEYETIIVDNASSDGTPDAVTGAYPWARVLRRARNDGLSAAVNDGVRGSTGRYVAVLNPDIRLDSDALTELASYLERNDDVGVAAPRLLDDDGTLQLSCRAFPGYATAIFSRYSLLTRLFPGNRFSRRYMMSGFDHARTADVDWVSGAAMMFPRAVFDALGGWDPRFFLFSEDVDFCKRVHDAGKRVIYHPAATLYHRIGISRRPAPRIIIERHRSMWRYYRKHLRRNVAVDAVTGAGIVARCLLVLGAHYAGRIVAPR